MEKTLPDLMNEALMEATGTGDDLEIKEASVSLVRHMFLTLGKQVKVAAEECQDYEGGHMEPKDFADNMRLNWLNIIQTMDRIHKKLSHDMKLDISGAVHYMHGWK